MSAARSYHDGDMEMFETRTYRFMLGLSRLILLNLAWAVASLPVVTFIPATAAMFGVIREWRRGDEPSVFPRFVHHFRANFGRRLETRHRRSAQVESIAILKSNVAPAS